MKKSEIRWENGVITSWDIDELDLDKSIESQVHLLKEDLMQARFGDGIILDLGWYPEFDPRGQFVLSVVREQEWGNPVLQLKFRELSQFTQNLNRAIRSADGYASK
jgi:hypothetical protein